MVNWQGVCVHRVSPHTYMGGERWGGGREGVRRVGEGRVEKKKKGGLKS
jgi:hypothetical protein